MNKTKELTEKWNKSGLLDKMNDKDKSKMSVILEIIAKKLVETCPPEKDKHDQFAGTILPIARRIYDQLKGKKFPNPIWLMEDFKKFWEENTHLLSEMDSYLEMDREAELCSMYCDDVVKRIK